MVQDGIGGSAVYAQPEETGESFFRAGITFFG